MAGGRSPLRVAPVAFDEAVAASVSRSIVLPDVYYGQMQGIERAIAFSIADIASLDQLQQTLDSLTRATAEGLTFDEWRKEALTSPDVLALPRHRLDNIFRTNIQGAYARGRCVHIARHRDVRPYLMYDAINDSRTRPSHLAMDGHVAPVDDKIWNIWMPPAGYRCRCTVISLTKEQADERARQDAERLANDADLAEARQDAIRLGPDHGWDYSPCGDVDRVSSDALRGKHYSPGIDRIAASVATGGAIGIQSADPSSWTKVDEAQDGNPGGIYQAPNGGRYHVRLYADPLQPQTEYALMAVHRAVGSLTLDVMPVVIEGAHGTASPVRDDLVELADGTRTERQKRQLAKIYAVAALTAQDDVADRVMVTKDGDVIMTGAGAGFVFGGNGKRRTYPSSPVEEMTTLLDPMINPAASALFGDLTDAQLAVAIRRLKAVTKKLLAVSLGASRIIDDEDMVDATMARRRWMMAGQ